MWGFFISFQYNTKFIDISESAEKYKYVLKE